MGTLHWQQKTASCLPQVPPALLMTFDPGLQEGSCKVLQHALSLIDISCLMLVVHHRGRIRHRRWLDLPLLT